MVRVESLSFAYKKESPIFSNFNWTIKHGERWSIIGRSGCGKTTLLYLLAGLRKPSSGTIAINNGDSITKKAKIGLILQDFGLLPWATAFQNISLGLKIQGIEKQKIQQITSHWLIEMGIDSVSSHFPGELSGGQRQRVAIARTLALEPALLLMDEPFASLDTMTREDLLELTLSLWYKQPFTTVLVTHNIEEAVFWGKRILVLNHAPIAQPVIVENEGSGSTDYKNSADFSSICQQLRAMVELDSHNKKASKTL